MRARLLALVSLALLGCIGRDLGAQGRGQDTRPGIDCYGDFRLEARLVNVETSEIVKVESDRMQRDHLFDIIRTVAARLMKDTNLPPLPRQASDQRTNRQIPTEALTFYSKALLFQDRGQKDKAAEMYQRALAVFPEYTEAQQGLQRMKNS